MQNVACPITIVQMLKLIPIGARTFRIVACSARPGDDSGQRDRKNDEERDDLAPEEPGTRDRE